MDRAAAVFLCLRDIGGLARRHLAVAGFVPAIARYGGIMPVLRHLGAGGGHCRRAGATAVGQHAVASQRATGVSVAGVGVLGAGVPAAQAKFSWVRRVLGAFLLIFLGVIRPPTYWGGFSNFVISRVNFQWGIPVPVLCYLRNVFNHKAAN